MATDGEGKLADLLTQAKEQLASLNEDMQRGLKSAQDPEQRRKIAVDSIDLVQRGLALAKDGLDRLRERTTHAAPGHSAQPFTNPDDPAGESPVAE